MPTEAGQMEIYLGDWKKIRSQSFSPVNNPLVIPRFKLDYEQIRKQVLAKNYSPKLHQKYLAIYQKILSVPWTNLIPAGLPQEPPFRPETQIKDTFNRADNATFDGNTSSEGWTWTEIVGTAWEIISNAAGMKDSVIGTNQFARANSDLSSDNHMAQHIVSVSNPTATSDENTGVLIRNKPILAHF
jgi:hypothetical protein